MPKVRKRRKTSYARNASTREPARLLEVRSLLPHSEFDGDLTRLAQDFARYYAAMGALSVKGVTNLSLAMPCRVLLTGEESRPAATVVGGLAMYYIARAVSLDSVVNCHATKKTSDWEEIKTSERLRLLSVAPHYCRDDSDGGAMLKRIWGFYTADERCEIYGVTTFKQFAKRFRIRARNLPTAPRTRTARVYEPWANEQRELFFPEI